jgi:hypothetical protein
MSYKIVLYNSQNEFFLQDLYKDIEYKEKRDAERFKACIEGCERLVGYFVKVVEIK